MTCKYCNTVTEPDSDSELPTFPWCCRTAQESFVILNPEFLAEDPDSAEEYADVKRDLKAERDAEEDRELADMLFHGFGDDR